MKQTKNRSIKMTDEQYDAVRIGALERHLPIGEFMRLLCDEHNAESHEPDPELIFGLFTIKEIMQYPKGAWNEDVMKLFDEAAEKVCTLLKW